MKIFPIALAILLSSFVGANAQERDAYRYSGQHAGGPANDLIPSAPVPPKARPYTNPAYRRSGQHAGGPAGDLIPRSAVAPQPRKLRNPAYRYSGQHAGGPANDLVRR